MPPGPRRGPRPTGRRAWATATGHTERLVPTRGARPAPLLGAPPWAGHRHGPAGASHERLLEDPGPGEENDGAHHVVTGSGTARPLALRVCAAQLVWGWSALLSAVSPPVLAEGAGRRHPLWLCGGPGRAPAHRHESADDYTTALSRRAGAGRLLARPPRGFRVVPQPGRADCRLSARSLLPEWPCPVCGGSRALPHGPHGLCL